MNENIIPRYSNNQVEEYTTTSLIKQHQPEIIKPLEPKKTLQLEQNLNQLSLEDKKNLLAIESRNKTKPTIEDDRYLHRNLYSPNLRLTGHVDEVYSLDFSSDGAFLVSAGKDRRILLWDVYNNCSNIGINSEPKNAILQVKFSGDSEKIFAASADDCLHAIDKATMVRFKKFKGHKDILTSVDCSQTGTDIILTSSIDCNMRVWDLRSKSSVVNIQDNFPLLSSVLVQTYYSHCWSAGIDNLIKKWDLRKADKPVMILEGHTDCVTSLEVNSDNTKLLSNCMDNTVRTWNVKPFCLSENRCIKVFSGHSHGYEKNLIRSGWSRDYKLVASGSSDNNLYVWNATNRQIKMKLGGHEAVVNDVKFSPTNEIIASCSNDRSIIITEFPKNL